MAAGSSGGTSRLPRGRQRSWASRAAIAAAPALATAVLLLGGLEWFARSQLDVYRCDPTLGWTFRPDARGIKWNRHREFLERVSFNSAGFRDLEREASKPAGTFRILVLGDSFTASLQVPRENGSVARVEAGLAARLLPGHGLEVINAGVDGFGTAQELLLLRHRLAGHAPDLVLLQIFMENDLTDNWREAGDWNHYLAARCGRPYFELVDRELRFAGLSTPAPPARLLDRLLQHSQLWASLIPVSASDGASPPAFINFDLFRPDPPPALWKAWRLTQRLVLELRDEAHAHGARFALLVLPDKRAAGQMSEEEQRSLGRATSYLRRGHDLIVDFTRQHGIPALDLLPILRREVEEGRAPFFAIDSHLTREGHAVTAGAIVEWLADHCAELRIPLRSCPS